MPYLRTGDVMRARLSPSGNLSKFVKTSKCREGDTIHKHTIQRVNDASPEPHLVIAGPHLIQKRIRGLILHCGPWGQAWGTSLDPGHVMGEHPLPR